MRYAWNSQKSMSQHKFLRKNWLFRQKSYENQGRGYKNAITQKSQKKRNNSNPNGPNTQEKIYSV